MKAKDGQTDEKKKDMKYEQRERGGGTRRRDERSDAQVEESHHQLIQSSINQKHGDGAGRE
jgi:hypothetical protein